MTISGFRGPASGLGVHGATFKMMGHQGAISGAAINPFPGGVSPDATVEAKSAETTSRSIDSRESGIKASSEIDLSKVRAHLKAKRSSMKAFALLTKVAVAGGLAVGLGAALVGTGGLAGVAAAPLMTGGGAALLSGIAGAGSQLLRGIFNHGKAESAMFESRTPRRQKEILTERINNRNDGSDALTAISLGSWGGLALGTAIGAYPVAIAAGVVCLAANGKQVANIALNARDEKRIAKLVRT